MPNRATISRRAFLAGSAACCASALLPKSLLGVTQHAPDTESLPLRSRAQAKGFTFGAATAKRYLVQDQDFAAAFARECGVLVAEWELKWDAIRPSPSEYSFDNVDWLLGFAHRNGMAFRGHTLVWHHDLPDWFEPTVSRRNAEGILTDHITRVVSRYAGRVHSWDVVNEAILPWDGRADGLRQTPWLQMLGPDYIATAFHAARRADPSALLVYNDFGLDDETPPAEAKRKAVLQLLERLTAKGAPVHALGIQGHLEGSPERFDPARFRKFLRNVSSMGLQILITELDVADEMLPADSRTRDLIVADRYRRYVSTALEEQHVVAVITWGLSNRYTWLAKKRPRRDGLPVRPLPLDADLGRGPVWEALATAFDGTDRRL